MGGTWRGLQVIGITAEWVIGHCGRGHGERIMERGINASIAFLVGGRHAGVSA